MGRAACLEVGELGSLLGQEPTTVTPSNLQTRKTSLRRDTQVSRTAGEMLKDRPRLPSCLLGKHWPWKEDCLSAALGPLTLQETRVKLGAESLQVKNFRHPLTVPGCTGLFRNFVQAFFHLIFFNNFIYVFIFGYTRSWLLHRFFSSCGAWASHWGGFSSYRAWALG